MSADLMRDAVALIVEDHDAVRRALRERIQASFVQLQLREAGSVEEALRIVECERVDYVFMDIRLPGENGLQLTERIKTRYPDTKVVILTSYDSLEYREAALRCGASCFLSKDSMNWEQIEALVKSFGKVE